DMIIFVSRTGIATPSIDTLLMNDRPFRANVMRMTLRGLGCAGGAIGLSRTRDWLVAHSDNNVLDICSELCSLTFHKADMRNMNLIGTALFGDGTSAVLLMGERSPYQNYQKQNGPKIIQTSSVTEKNRSQVMGWNVTNQGFEVI